MTVPAQPAAQLIALDTRNLECADTLLSTFDGVSAADLLDRSWDDNAQAWTRAVRSGQIESRRVATDRAIVDAILRRAPERVLDVGCGEGWLCRALRGYGVKCAGVDGSSELIREARSADPEGVYHLLRFADVERLPQLVRGASIDVAVCNFALLHEDISSILEAIHEVMRPDATLLIQTVHPWMSSETFEYIDGWRSEEFTWSATPFPRPMPWYFRTLESWIDTIRETGFRIDRVGEPAHPESRKPLSLLISAVRPGVIT